MELFPGQKLEIGKPGVSILRVVLIQRNVYDVWEVEILEDSSAPEAVGMHIDLLGIKLEHSGWRISQSSTLDVSKLGIGTWVPNKGE